MPQMSSVRLLTCDAAEQKHRDKVFQLDDEPLETSGKVGGNFSTVELNIPQESLTGR